MEELPFEIVLHILQFFTVDITINEGNSIKHLFGYKNLGSIDGPVLLYRSSNVVAKRNNGHISHYKRTRDDINCSYSCEGIEAYKYISEVTRKIQVSGIFNFTKISLTNGYYNSMPNITYPNLIRLTVKKYSGRGFYGVYPHLTHLNIVFRMEKLFTCDRYNCAKMDNIKVIRTNSEHFKRDVLRSILIRKRRNTHPVTTSKGVLL